MSAMTRRGFMTHLMAFGLVAGVTPFREAVGQERVTPGGVLRTTLSNEPNSLDPHRPITVYEFTMRGAFFNGLVEETPALTLKPALAENIVVSGIRAASETPYAATGYGAFCETFSAAIGTRSHGPSTS